MKILFAVTHVGFLRNFESTLALLAERGHQVHIASDRRQVADVIDTTPILDRLRARHPGAFTEEAIPFDKRSPWYLFSTFVRGALDYWRYLAPEFDDAPALRARGRANAPRVMVWLSDLPGLRRPAGIRMLRRVLTWVERAVPARNDVHRLLDRAPWDLVFLTPLLYFGSQQIDYVRAARQRSIPTLLGVGSWDHLTTKGLIHERPDRVVVWNEHQRREAAELHGIDPSRVVVTGAQAYDHWFALEPSTTREAFCARVGLPADRPYLLYLCSSPFIAPHEVPFVRSWIAGVRGSGSELLRTAGIMVRPHPQNAAQWADVDLSAYGDVAIWPRAGANPINLSARYEYYDSMHHSHAVVGINTSALIESGIVGRLVYSIRAAEFASTQEGTLHFHHLRRGGLLRMADSLAAHIGQLERSFASVERDREEIRQFIQHFVRPSGLDRPATPQVVDAAEATALLKPASGRLPAGIRLLQLLLTAMFMPFGPAPKVRGPRIRVQGPSEKHWRAGRRYWLSWWRPVAKQPRRFGRWLRVAVTWSWVSKLATRWRKALYRWQKMGRARVPGMTRRALAAPRRVAARALGRTGAAPPSKRDEVL